MSRFVQPCINCGPECFGMLGCQCPPGTCCSIKTTLPRPLPVPRLEPGRSVFVVTLSDAKPVGLTDRMDINGRLPEAWDYGLPHSKCGCGACASWRAVNWSRLCGQSASP